MDLSKSDLLFIAQVVLVYIVVIASIVNLSINTEEQSSRLWIILLSSGIGYLLPNPKLKRTNGDQ